MRCGHGAGKCRGRHFRGAEALESEYLKENRYLEPWTHPRLGPVIGVRGFSDFSRTPTGFRYPTPDLGQHTRELLAEFGLPATRIEALFEAGAVFQPQESAALVGAG